MVHIAHAAALVASVSGHGDLNIPLPRNNRGAQPIDTPPGESHGPSCLGDACGWFQAGCYIGCDVCGNQTSGGADCSPENPCRPETVPCQAMEPTLPDEFRTYNLEGLSPNGDWTKYHPWRAPGHAPVHDACGVAGAYDHGDRGVMNEWPPLYPGSLLAQTEPTVWLAGEASEVAWSIWANHGGGYQYRVCKDDVPSEQCFQASVLRFADESTVIRSPYGNFSDFSIDAHDVSAGTWPEGSTWRKNPIPACNCDRGYNCTVDDEQSIFKAYKEDAGAGRCPTGFQFAPEWAKGFGYWGSGAHYTGHSLEWAIVDRVLAPEEPGRYVLQWRWDCENSPQIWGNCADIMVVPRVV